jgi:hypothetical protein
LSEVAAVIGREVEFRLLQRAADLGEDAAADVVEELVRHRILRQATDGLEFAHDRIREVVWDGLLPGRWGVLHRRVAAALQALHAHALDAHALAIGLHFGQRAASPRAST